VTNYHSHVLYFPASAPFDQSKHKWPSFIGGFVTPSVTSNPGLTYWFSYCGDHAKFRVYTGDYEAIRGQIEAERDRLGLEDRGGEKTLTLIEDIGGGRFISPHSKSNPLRRAEVILRALCANANLIVDSEADLQRALMANLRQFLLELGSDFTFVGERYRLQVGGRDFFVDLPLFHRGLTCLVALGSERPAGASTVGQAFLLYSLRSPTGGGG
jgi:YhcG PDDEXK nuclease domain